MRTRTLKEWVEEWEEEDFVRLRLHREINCEEGEFLAVYDFYQVPLDTYRKRYGGDPWKVLTDVETYYVPKEYTGADGIALKVMGILDEYFGFPLVYHRPWPGENGYLVKHPIVYKREGDKWRNAWEYAPTKEAEEALRKKSELNPFNVRPFWEASSQIIYYFEVKRVRGRRRVYFYSMAPYRSKDVKDLGGLYVNPSLREFKGDEGGKRFPTWLSALRALSAFLKIINRREGANLMVDPVSGWLYFYLPVKRELENEHKEMITRNLNALRRYVETVYGVVYEILKPYLRTPEKQAYPQRGIRVIYLRNKASDR